jgi:CheY-like chemotaxis protein
VDVDLAPSAEDELMFRMLLVDMLTDLGCTIAAEATGLSDALEATRNADFDIAILDVNLGGGEPIGSPSRLWQIR